MKTEDYGEKGHKIRVDWDDLVSPPKGVFINLGKPIRHKCKYCKKDFDYIKGLGGQMCPHCFKEN